MTIETIHNETINIRREFDIDNLRMALKLKDWDIIQVVLNMKERELLTRK